MARQPRGLHRSDARRASCLERQGRMPVLKGEREVTKTSLYRHFAEDGELLYIGISVSFLSRLGQHEKHSPWFDRIYSVTVEHFDTREEALKAERDAIKSESPTHNKHHKVTQGETRFEADQSRERLAARLVRFQPFYNTKEVAEVLKVSEQTVKRLIKSGKLQAVFLRRQKRVLKGREIEYVNYGVTGWQLIDYIEGLEIEHSTIEFKDLGGALA